MKLIPVIVLFAGDKVEQYVNLEYIVSISPYFEYDEFDVLCKSGSFVQLNLYNGDSIIVVSSYDDFIIRLQNVAKLSKSMNLLEEV